MVFIAIMTVCLLMSSGNAENPVAMVFGERKAHHAK